MTLVVDGDEESSGPAVYDTELLASETDGRRVHDGHHLLDVLLQQTEE